MNNELKDSGDRTQFESGAVRDMHEGKGRFDLLPMCVLMRLAKHYEAGSKKYGDRNWEKGIPCHSYADSAMRHFVKYMDGWNDEDHLIAAIWNLCCLAWTEEKRPDLMNIPARLEKQSDLNIIPARVETYPDLKIIPAKVEKRSKVEKHCMSCKHEIKSMECEPCSSCVGHDKWEDKSEVMNYCASCKYKGYSVVFEPCFSCSNYSNYDKWEEETNDHDNQTGNNSKKD